MNEEILKRLDALAAKLGVTAQYLWGVLIRQARLEAVASIIEAIVCALLAAAAAWLSVVLFKKACKASYDMEDIYGIGCVLSVIAGVVLFIVAVVCACSWVTPFFNPEYWALEKVLATLK